MSSFVYQENNIIEFLSFKYIKDSFMGYNVQYNAKLKDGTYKTNSGFITEDMLNNKKIKLKYIVKFHSK